MKTPTHALPRRIPAPPFTRGAFTLIELLTVIAIIGILAAIIIPTVGRVRESAKSARCLSNLRECGKAFTLFAAENKNRIPAASQFIDGQFYSWTRYVMNWRAGNPVDPSYYGIYCCPSTEEPPFDIASGTIYRTYGMLHGGLTIAGYNVTDWLDKTAGASFHHLARVPAPSRIPLLMDTITYAGAGQGRQFYYFYSNATKESAGIHLRHGNKANTLFYDGHVKAMNVQEMANLGFTTQVVATDGVTLQDLPAATN